MIIKNYDKNRFQSIYKVKLFHSLIPITFKQINANFINARTAANCVI